jgi:ABC-type transport system involved in cytochrome c biogenesis ATPase subunit
MHAMLLFFKNQKKNMPNVSAYCGGLGFSQKQLAEPVNSLSVGWKMRIILAQLLLKKADFYLLMNQQTFRHCCKRMVFTLFETKQCRIFISMS